MIIGRIHFFLVMSSYLFSRVTTGVLRNSLVDMLAHMNLFDDSLIFVFNVFNLLLEVLELLLQRAYSPVLVDQLGSLLDVCNAGWYACCLRRGMCGRSQHVFAAGSVAQHELAPTEGTWTLLCSFSLEVTFQWHDFNLLIGVSVPNQWEGRCCHKHLRLRCVLSGVEAGVSNIKEYVAIAFINDRLFDDKQLWVLVFHEITTVVLDLPKRLSVWIFVYYVKCYVELGVEQQLWTSLWTILKGVQPHYPSL